MKVAYITAHAPFGRGETFVLEEMFAMADLGVELLIVPRNPPKEVFHASARRLLDRAVWLPLFNWWILLSFLGSVLFNPSVWKILYKILRHSRSLKILAKNFAVAPKAVYVAGLLRRSGVEHIHAHWGSTTATMAYVAAELTGIPWSFTLHRWDIAENNMLKAKAESAIFVRCISEDGKKEVLNLIGQNFATKVQLVHMGVFLHALTAKESKGSERLIIACPANFVPVKGHRFLIEACALLREKGINEFQCLFIGDGPLEAEIRRLIAHHGLEGVVSLVGRLPHEELMRMYRNGEVDVVVLPSILTDTGEKEGIPVALMEAMAYGIPVVSTNVGGIPELLSNGAGLVVQDKDALQLARALETLAIDPKLARKIGERGRLKVEGKFNLRKNAASLELLFKGAQKDSHIDL